MRLFPPYFDLNSEPKCPNFNPLLKNNNLNMYELEKLDDHVLLENKCYKFLNRIKKTVPLFHLDEVIGEFWEEIVEQEKRKEEITKGNTGNSQTPCTTSASGPIKTAESQHHSATERSERHETIMLHSFSNNEHTMAKKVDRIVNLNDFENFLLQQNESNGNFDDIFLKTYIADKNERQKQEMIRLGQLKRDENEDTRWVFPWLDYSSVGTTADNTRRNTAMTGGTLLSSYKAPLTAGPDIIEANEIPSTADLNSMFPTESITLPEQEDHNLTQEIESLCEGYQKYFSQEDYEYLCILLSAENSKELFNIIKSLKSINNKFQNLSEIIEKYEFKTPLVKRKLMRLLNNLDKQLNSEIYTVYDSYLDEIFEGVFEKFRAEIVGIRAVEKDFIKKEEKDNDKIEIQNATNMQPTPIKSLVMDTKPGEDYYVAYERLTKFSVS